MLARDEVYLSVRNSLMVLADSDCTDCAWGGLGRALAVSRWGVLYSFWGDRGGLIFVPIPSTPYTVPPHYHSTRNNSTPSRSSLRGVGQPAICFIAGPQGCGYVFPRRAPPRAPTAAVPRVAPGVRALCYCCCRCSAATYCCCAVLLLLLLMSAICFSCLTP